MSDRERFIRFFRFILVLLVLSAVFSVYLADMVGYHEPLDLVADRFNFTESSLYDTVFSDYTFPGLPDFVGYIVAGFIGVLIIVGLGYVADRYLGAESE